MQPTINVRVSHGVNCAGDHCAKLEGLERPVVLSLVDPIRYQDTVVELLRYFLGRTTRGIYVTLNRPFATLTRTFEKAEIPVGSLFFLDRITNVPSTQEESAHTCIGLGKGLSALCIEISKTVNRFTEEKFLMLNSLSTLLIYDDSRNVAKFAHLLTEKMRRWGIAGSLLTVEMNMEPMFPCSLLRSAIRC